MIDDKEFEEVKALTDKLGTNHVIDYIFKTTTKDEKKDLLDYIENIYGLEKA